MENRIWRITLDTNPEDCNLHCIMCEEHSHLSTCKNELFAKTGIKRRVMPRELIKSIIQEASELGIKEIIPTTMGDPLVSNSFEYMTELILDKKIKMNLTHNGTFPGKSASEWAKIIVPNTSDIKISWNGARAETAEYIMKGLKFDKAKINLKEFIQYRDHWYKQCGHYCSVTLQLTFMRNNMNEIDKIIEFAAAAGVDRIKGHHLWVHHQEMEMLSFRINSETKADWNKIVDLAYTSVNQYIRKDGKQIKLENFSYLENVQNQEIPYDYDCPFLGKELWISATGKISPCCAPDKQRDSLGDFRNISTQTMQQTFESIQYKDLLNNYKTKEICKTCTMRKPK
jgi:radical SAM protein with 4Fe4S-binding SPASM domain